MDDEETIMSIVTEMREWAERTGSGILGNWPDRLERAYKRHLSTGMMCTMSCRENGRLLEMYAEENKRLHALVKELKKGAE